MTHPMPDRRTFLAGSAAIAVAVGAAGAVQAGEGDLNLFVGTYTSDAGKGIYPLTYTAATDTWAGGPALYAIENVSFGAYSRGLGRHYLVDENNNAVGVYHVSSDGVWHKSAQVSSQGAAPCYITLDPSERYLAIANYGGGDVVVFRLDDEGKPVGGPVIRQNHGTGPNADRQEGPHAHCVKFAPDQKTIYSVDLGTDQLLGYSFDAESGAIGDSFVAFQAPAGSGPRHVAFHPDGEIAYLVSELSNQIFVLRRHGDGAYGSAQTLSSLPDDFEGSSAAAHIALNRTGDILYVSNRGHNSISVFSVGPGGALTLVQSSPTLGDWPRFFCVMEEQRRLLVAHQRGGTIVVFKINDDGTLAPTGQSIEVPQPVFIAPV